GGGAGEGEPLAEDGHGLVGVDFDVAVVVVGAGGLDVDALVPAVHAADRIGLDREGQVLVDAAVGPPDARAVAIGALPRLDVFDAADAEAAGRELLAGDAHARPAIGADVVE